MIPRTIFQNAERSYCDIVQGEDVGDAFECAACVSDGNIAAGVLRLESVGKIVGPPSPRAFIREHFDDLVGTLMKV